MLSPLRSFSPFRTAARGLEAQRVALGVATENIANATTTRTADGTPYQPKRAVHEAPAALRAFESSLRAARLPLQTANGRHIGGVRHQLATNGPELGPTTEVVGEARERLEYDPTHPDADADGYVHYPDVNVVDEMARMISANRIYEANLTSVKAAKEMIKRSLEI
ncbi:flagellar basal body rod protein FlgC [Rubrivirga marina]|uniref:Flagellar basal-body rod protein FlgC n=1 Tax=Rubrivirga marina TaxID=1196024 RepID=A0A271IX31_9BACT|nr:flagellar basal body rod protein FlgC [Rubrivirga marina]PAP75773.1 flagellar basal body rod protein FlgC [Rubrivirga marina]